MNIKIMLLYEQLVLGLTAFFVPKFQIGVMKWCLLELFNKIIGT